MKAAPQGKIYSRGKHRSFKSAVFTTEKIGERRRKPWDKEKTSNYCLPRRSLKNEDGSFRLKVVLVGTMFLLRHFDTYILRYRFTRNPVVLA